MDIEKAKELLNLCPICIGNHEGCNCERHNAYVWVFEQLEWLESDKPRYEFIRFGKDTNVPSKGENDDN